MPQKRISRKAAEEKTAEPRKTLGNAANVVRPQKPTAPAKSASKGETREQILQTRFHPDAINFLKENFGIDLASNKIDIAVLYDIADGRVTSQPIEAVVRPVAYDRQQKKNVDLSPVKTVSSFRFVFPYERTAGGKTPLPIDDEHKVFVAAYPCYDYVMKADPSEMDIAPAAERKEKGEVIKFSPAQVVALEGLGIREERLYSNAFNAIPEDIKSAMIEGRPFPMTGTVRVMDNASDSRMSINVNGTAQMVTRKDGTVLTKFEPQYPVERSSKHVVDLLAVRQIGDLELDFFERDLKGNQKTDVYGNPIINQAGKDLIKYGAAFTPVTGFVHKRVFDDKMHEFRDSISSDKYQVTLVNGGLCVTPMKKVMEKDQKGNQVMTVSRTGEDVPKYHYECRDAHVSSEGKVRVGTQDLEPVSAQDLENYKRGRGGAFKGYEYTDYKTHKKVVYDVFAYPDNQRNGFAKGFSPSVSEELIKRQQDAKKTVSKKQNFSMGF